MSVQDLTNTLQDLARVFEAKENYSLVVEGDDPEIKLSLEGNEEQIDRMFASALAVALAQIEEEYDLPIESVEDAVRVIMDSLIRMRSKNKDILRKSLRAYDRIGGDRLMKIYRRELAKGEK